MILNVIEHRMSLADAMRAAYSTNFAYLNSGTLRSPLPSTYVPARNTVFLAVALGWAEVLGAAIGLNLQFGFTGLPNFGQAAFLACGAFRLFACFHRVLWHDAQGISILTITRFPGVIRNGYFQAADVFSEGRRVRLSHQCGRTPDDSYSW